MKIQHGIMLDKRGKTNVIIDKGLVYKGVNDGRCEYKKFSVPC